MLLLVIAAIGAVVAVLAHTAPAPFLLDAFHPGVAAWHLPAGDPLRRVYLTFDDGPNPRATPMLLDVLALEQAKATFFLIDDHLTDDTAPIVKRMFTEGHAVGVHSNDRWLMLEDEVTLAATISVTANRIAQLGGGEPCRWFRPHAGWRSGEMYDALERTGYRLAGWSWGLWDFNWGRARNPVALAARLSRRANPGDIIVIHDGHHRDPAADRAYAVETARRLVPALRARGLDVAALPCL